MKRFQKFFGVGTVGFAVDAGFTLLLVSVLNWSPMLGRIPAFLVATLVTYGLNRRITFPGSNGSWGKGWLNYVGITIFGALFNYLVYSLVLLIPGERLLILLLGIVLGSTVGLFFNYTLSLRIIFRHVLNHRHDCNDSFFLHFAKRSRQLPGIVPNETDCEATNDNCLCRTSILHRASRILQSFIFGALTAIIFSIFLLALNCWATKVPGKVAQTRVLQAIETGNLTTLDQLKFDRIRGVNQYNDCLILSMTMLRSGDRWKDALAPLIPVKYPQKSEQSSICRMLWTMAEAQEPLEANISLTRYNRYWHGLPAITAVLLQYMRISQLRVSFKLIFYCLYGVLVLMGLRQWVKASKIDDSLSGIGITIAGLSFMLFWGAEYFVQSLTDSFPAFALAFFLMVIVWLRPMERKPLVLNIFAALFGTITMYLEFLSGPIPLGAAVLIAILGLQAPRQLPRRESTLRLFCGLFAYITALVASYLTKMAPTILLLGDRVYSEIWSTLSYRMSSHSSPIATNLSSFDLLDLINHLRWNLDQIAWGSHTIGYILIFLAFAQLMVGGLWLLTRGRLNHPASFAMAAVLLSVLVMPAWYVMFLNHTIVHAWYMIRIVVWPIAAGWIAIAIILTSHLYATSTEYTKLD